MESKYLFTSERLGFRAWQDEDLDAFTAMNTDPEVMKYFPALQERAQTLASIRRMQEQYRQKGHCYYAIETLADGDFIGFTGISELTFVASSTTWTRTSW